MTSANGFGLRIGHSFGLWNFVYFFFFCGCWFDLDLRRSLLGFINDIWDSCAVVNKLKTGAKGLILLECCFYFDRTRLSKFLESGTLFESVVFTFDWA